MNGYKKFIPKELRFKILHLLKFVPDKQMLQLQYWIKTKRILNLKNPKRYTEKVQWSKLFYRNAKMSICVDKYRVREYLAEKGLEDITVKLYAVYDNPHDVKLKDLPNRFILKTTNGSGTNVICKNKSELDEKKLNEKIEKFFYQTSSSAGREWAYGETVPRIIVEELLEDPSSPDGSVNDYKFLCFNGKPEYIVLDVDRFTNHKRNIYDTQWNDLHIASDCSCADGIYEPPANLSEMLHIAEQLSKDFPAVRVDLYSISGKVYFGELTFFPWSGYVQFSPDNFDYELGEKFILPNMGGGYKQLLIVYIAIVAAYTNEFSIDDIDVENIVANACRNFREEVAA